MIIPGARRLLALAAVVLSSPSGIALSAAPSSRRWHRGSLHLLGPRPVLRHALGRTASATDQLCDEDGEGSYCSSATFVVPPDGGGTRLDKFLSSVVPDQSRTYLASLCESGHVSIAASPGTLGSRVALTKKSHKVSPGDTIEVSFVLNEAFEIVPENIPLDILYEDENVIAVNKPVGLVVHPAPGNWNGTLVNALAHYFQAQVSDAPLEGDVVRAGSRMELRPGIVHRLDKGTSGVMITAKSADAAAWLSDAFKSRTVSKTYLGVAVGLPAHGEAAAGPSYAPATGASDPICDTASFAAGSGSSAGPVWQPYGRVAVAEPLGRDPANRFKVAVVASGKPARSLVTPVAFNGQVSLVKVAIESGRTHQIRVHLAHLRHPILGDELYGFKDWNCRYLPRGVERPLLHAAELIVPLPPSPSGLPPSARAKEGGGATATVVVGGGGYRSWLRLRCPPPPDFLHVAEGILDGPLDLDALLDHGDPRAARPRAQPTARGGAGGSRVAESSGPSPVAPRTLPFPSMLAQAEARRGGWYD